MPLPAPAPLAGWISRSFTHDGLTHTVHERGTGPAVILLPELPGITPQVRAFADAVVEAGFRVSLPSLTGTDGAPLTAGRLVASMGRLCVAREFRAFAVAAARPFTTWLRALAADVARSTGAPSVGVIGMCFTGGFALAAAADPLVSAAVVSQPSLPFPVSTRHRADVGLSPDERTAVAARARAGAVCALGLRFSNDQASPRERFDGIRDLLGGAFEVIEIESAPGNPHGISPHAHTVLTTDGAPADVVDSAREQVVAFLRRHLPAGSAPTG